MRREKHRVEATEVLITTYRDEALNELPEFANYTRGSRAQGLAVHTCECGAHCWALPWADQMAAWVWHQLSPIRAWLEANGLAPKEPEPTAHVILTSPEDACLLKQRRWRVFPTKKGHRARWYLQAGRRGLPLQRMIYPTAEAITFDNGNGLDVRRENVRRTTIRKLLQERDARRRGRKSKRSTTVA